MSHLVEEHDLLAEEIESWMKKTNHLVEEDESSDSEYFGLTRPLVEAHLE